MITSKPQLPRILQRTDIDPIGQNGERLPIFGGNIFAPDGATLFIAKRLSRII